MVLLTSLQHFGPSDLNPCQFFDRTHVCFWLSLLILVGQVLWHCICLLPFLYPSSWKNKHSHTLCIFTVQHDWAGWFLSLSPLPCVSQVHFCTCLWLLWPDVLKGAHLLLYILRLSFTVDLNFGVLTHKHKCGRLWQEMSSASSSCLFCPSVSYWCSPDKDSWTIHKAFP